MSDWKIFQGTRTPHDDIVERLPPAPSWRQFGQGEKKSRKQKRGETYQARPEEIEMVNAALYLRRPLLVTGKPGTGKTSLAYAIAYELNLGEVLYWGVTTRTTLKDGLYRYDAIGRVQDTQPGAENQHNIGKYMQLGSLGTALLPAKKPRILLIDEIDKGDIDLPNDLLHVFEEGRFEIPELVRMVEQQETVEIRTAYTDETEFTFAETGKTQIHRGRVQCEAFPLVILTSNGEREFPPPFLRRCLRLEMKEPDQTELERIVREHFREESAPTRQQIDRQLTDLITQFLEKRKAGDLATDQLLNAVYLVSRKSTPQEKEKQDLVNKVLQYLNRAEEV